MEQIKLNKENPEITFKLNGEDSYLLIHSVCITSQNNFENEWTHFISTVNIIAELRYVVYDDPLGRHTDERKKQLPIHFHPDLHQIQPVFNLNSFIKNEPFSLGINKELMCYQTLKLALQNVEDLNEDYTIEFTIEKHNLDD